MLIVPPLVPYKLIMVADDGNTGLYGRATIYSDAVGYVGFTSLWHDGNGIYLGSYTFPSIGRYYITYQFYLEPGHGSLAPYAQGFDRVEVSSIIDDIPAIKTNADLLPGVDATTTATLSNTSTLIASSERILGLLHENTVVDQQVYDGNGYLISSRIRAYDTKTNADAAGSFGLMYTWTMTASYTGANLTNFKIVREP